MGTWCSQRKKQERRFGKSWISLRHHETAVQSPAASFHCSSFISFPWFEDEGLPGRVRDTNTDKRSRKAPSSSCWWLQISEHQQVCESPKAPVAAQEPYFHWHNPTGTTSCGFRMFLLYFPCCPTALHRYPGSNSYRFSC